MRVELLECKRCCCCIPLRYGLMFWGYLKLVLVILTIGLEVYKLTTIRTDAPNILMIIVNTIDFVFTLLFVVSAHKKNPKLLRVYYYYCITETSLGALLVLGIIGWIFFMSVTGQFGPFWIFVVYYSVPFLILMLVGLVLQAYIIMLVRSELMKLMTDQKNFMFVNNATEAEAACVMMNTEHTEKC